MSDFFFDQPASKIQLEDTRFLQKPIQDRTEKELELSKILIQRETLKKVKGIYNILLFFLWVTIISFIAWGIALIIEINSSPYY